MSNKNSQSKEQHISLNGNINVLYLPPFTRYSELKCARHLPRPLKIVKCKYANVNSSSHTIAIVAFATSVTIYETFATQNKPKSFTLKRKVKVMTERNGSCAIRLKIFKSLLVNLFQKCFLTFNTHTYSDRDRPRLEARSS